MWTLLFTFLIGFASLGSETIYLKLLDYSIGSAPLLVFLTVGCFILGQGIGSFLGLRISKVYLIELTLGIYSFLWAFFHEPLEKLIGLGILNLPFGIQINSAVIALLLIAIPCIGLGVSFPALVEINKSASKTSLYNAGGAFLGILFMELLGFPQLGIFNCLILLGIVHLSAAIYLKKFKFQINKSAFNFNPSIILLGVLTGSIQGIYLILMPYAFQPYYFMHITVISGFILGLSLGAKWWEKEKFDLENSKLLIAIGLVVSLLALSLLIKLPVHRFPSLLILALLFGLVLVVSVPIGTLFPALMDKHFHRHNTTTININLSSGNFLGLLLANFWVAKFASFELLYVIISILLIRSFFLLKEKILEFIIILSCLIFVIVNLSEYQLISLSTLNSPIEIEKIFRKPGELSAIYSVQYMGESSLFKTERRLYQNGFSPIDLNEKNESIIALLGTQYSQQRDEALVLGIGSGRTAGTVSQFFKHTDVVDISPSVRDVAQYLSSENFGLMFNPQVSYWNLDAIVYPHITEKKYDLIILTVDPGYHYQAAKLYTEEYFEKLKDLLRPTGIMVFWLDSSLSSEAQQVVINSSSNNFNHQKMSYIFKDKSIPSYYVVINSLSPLNSQPIDLSKWEDFKKYLLPERLFNEPISQTNKTNSIYRPAWSVILGGFYRNLK